MPVVTHLAAMMIGATIGVFAMAVLIASDD